jgi:hypothetical protein
VKVVTALLVVAGLVFGIMLLAPVIGFVLSIAIPLGFLFIWFLPILIILCSDKTTGGEKLAWILAIVFLSWFAWIFYALLAPIKRREDRSYSDYRSYRY